MVRRRSILLLCLLAVSCCLADGERYTYEFAPLEFFGDVGQSMFDYFASADTKEKYELYTPDQMRLMIRTLSGSLEGENLEELAAIQPQVRNVIKYLKRTPLMGGYADWLETRADYFDVAYEMLETEKLPQSPPQPVVRPAATPSVAPPPASQMVRREDLGIPAHGPQTEATTRVPRPTTIPRPDIPERTVVPPAAIPATSIAAGSAIGYQAEKERWIQKLSGRPEPAAAKNYVPRFRQIFVAEGIPAALVWQAEVESGFQVQAKSPAGALGMYQFMPGTAKQYGLSLSPKDERLDPDKSAKAAAQYLKSLHRRFGSWELALAAYNCGEGRLSTALKGAADPTFAGIRHKLPVETRMYVPKIAAVLHLRENVDLSTL